MQLSVNFVFSAADGAVGGETIMPFYRETKHLDKYLY